MVKLVLEVNFRVPETALISAAVRRQLEIIDILLDWGLNKPWFYGTEEKAARLWAASNGEVGIVRSLMSRGTVQYEETVDNYGKTPLHCAAFVGDDVTWSRTHCKGPPQGYNHGHKQVVEYLLLHKEVNVEEKDCVSKTALHYAADPDRYLSDTSGSESGIQKEIIKLLLDHGADMRAKDCQDRLPAHWAAANGNVETFSLLLHRKSDIDAKHQSGKTPLHCAIVGFLSNTNPYRNGKPSMVEFLLDQGADKDVQDEMGEHPCTLQLA